MEIIYIVGQIYYLQKITFTEFSLNYITIKKVNTDPDSSNKTQIEWWILQSMKKAFQFYLSVIFFYINIFDFNLDNYNSYTINNIDEYEINDGNNGLFAKSINLKDNNILFIYFTKKDDKLKLQLGKIEKISNTMNNQIRD